MSPFYFKDSLYKKIFSRSGLGVGDFSYQLSASEGKGQQALVQKTESGNSPT
ncbi:hypothetical protein N44_04353 [Microcystis aeruginosa NIES-44]|uniref:Uncharacterized protein n=1 Tax=Microcystis aeruginosa NIES-44 TaxID=449439 RepID=A0A0A1W188_MICAE|nr:hypothetical protein N44_04353 [Microcystis aeruginosa NIES-44]